MPITPNLELHPLCSLFPRMVGPAFESLKADILANGLRHPIVLHQGFILDGGNRYRACMESGVEPTYIDFAGGNLASFVMSVNMHRRHLAVGQYAAIVSSAQDWESAQPASRPGKPGNVAGLSTVAARAAQSGASDRTQRMADAVARTSPELAKQVAHGEISLPAAVKQIAAEKPVPQKPEVPVESPTPAAIPEPENDFGPSAAEIADAEKADADQLEYIKTILNSEDDPLAKALADLKMCRAEVISVKRERDGFQNKANDLIRMVKSLQAKLAKIERAS